MAAAGANAVTIQIGSQNNTSADFDALKVRLDALKNQRAQISIDTNDKDAVAKLARIDATIAALSAKTAKPSITVTGAAKAEADIAGVDLAMSKLGHTSDSAGASAEGAALNLGSLSGPMAGAIAAGTILSPVLITLGTGLAGFGAAAVGVLKPIENAASATGGLKANLGSLDTGQQQAAKSLLGLEGQFDKFSASMQPEVLSAFNTAIKTAGGLLTDVSPVAKATGTAIDGLLTRVDQEFQSGTWQSFFGFMAKTAGPDIQLLGTAFVNLMDTIPPLVEQLQPAATSLLELVDDGTKLIDVSTKITAALDGTSKSAQSSGGFMGILAGAAKNATEQIEPGLKSLPLLKKALDDVSGSSSKTASATGQAADGVKKVQTAAQLAAIQVTTLDTDWNNLVGNFATKDQVFQNATLAFSSLASTIKTSGANSATSKSAYDGYVESIQSSLTALKGAGASNSTLNGFLQTQIDRLKTLGPLTGAQAQELAGLEKYQTDVANSTSGMSKQDQALAKSMESSLIPQIKDLGAANKTTTTDTDNLTNAIINTGTKSAATKADRAQLIADLEKSGVNAHTATGLVDTYITQIGKIPKNASTNVSVTASGSGTISVSESLPGSKTAAVEKLIFGSTGLRLPGYGGGDVQPAMLEPGETVVSKESSRLPGMQAAFRAAGVPGYASGGLVASAKSADAVWPWGVGQANSWGAAVEKSWAAAIVAQAQADAKKAAQAAAAPAGSGGVSGNVASYAGDISAVLKMLSEPAGDLGAVEHRMEQESGGNPTIVNKTDSNWARGTPSVGLMQVIGPTFDLYAGPYRNTGPFEYGTSVNPMANIYAGLNYAKQVYAGRPLADVMLQPGGYAAGGATSGWGVVGEHGRELVRLPGGSTVIPNGQSESMLSGAGSGPVHVQLEINSSGAAVDEFLAQILRKYVRTRGGNVQAVFGNGA